MENTQYIVVKEANREELIDLYKDAGWWLPENDEDPSFVDRIVEKSFCFVIAVFENKIIGMGRSISDGISDAYIQDVVVLNKYRGKGIGGKIIDTIVDYLKSQKISWIGLIGEPGTQSFYEKHRFELMKNYIPMLFKDK